MKKAARVIMNMIPEKNRHQIYRKLAAVPAEYLNPEFKVQIAKTKEDLEAAYALLHDCYVGIKIIDPQPSGLRCNLFSFLPTTTIIVAKLGSRVVGTVSAVKDSKSGLPSDKDFLAENNKFRSQNKVIIEASALAVDPEFRTGHSVSFLLMKHLYFYCKDSFQGDHMIAAVHPKAEDFYKALWNFQKNGEPIGYESLKGAAAIHISLDLSDAHFQTIADNYNSKDPLKNIATMIENEDARFQYPNQNEGQSINPVITPDLLKYFCLEKKEIWSRLSPQDKNTLVQVYSTYFGADCMIDFKKRDMQIFNRQDYRTPVQISAVYITESQAQFSNLHDLTEGGCFIGTNGPKPKIGENISVSFRFDGKNYVAKGNVAWVNENLTPFCPQGFGICFETAIPSLNANIQKWIYSDTAEVAASENKTMTLKTA
jgi:Tfp pilus assembly protein PilZ